MNHTKQTDQSIYQPSITQYINQQTTNHTSMQWTTTTTFNTPTPMVQESINQCGNNHQPYYQQQTTNQWINHTQPTKPHNTLHNNHHISSMCWTNTNPTTNPINHSPNNRTTHNRPNNIQMIALYQGINQQPTSNQTRNANNNMSSINQPNNQITNHQFTNEPIETQPTNNN